MNKENTKLVKVKRLRDACCGMENGKIYTARSDFGGNYVSVQLPNGTWTSDHHVGISTFGGLFFEFIEDS